LTRERHWAATTPSAPIAYTTQSHLAVVTNTVVTNTETMSIRKYDVFSDIIQDRVGYSTYNISTLGVFG